MSEHTNKSIEAEAIAESEHIKTEDFRMFYERGFIAGRSKSVEEKEKEIERLKGLIREGFSLLQTAWGKTEEQKWNDWEKFKTENQL